MITFPLLAILIGMLFVLFYFMRKGVTYLNDGRPGSPWVAVVVFIIFAAIGWWLDAYLSFSTIPQFMLAVGGAPATYAWIGIGGLIILMIGMLLAQLKCGRMVA
jgi:amino acid transporter